MERDDYIIVMANKRGGGVDDVLGHLVLMDKWVQY